MHPGPHIQLLDRPEDGITVDSLGLARFATCIATPSRW